MAYFEAKLLTSLILQKFLVRVKPGFRAKGGESLTMPIAGGLPVTIQRRHTFFTEAKPPAPLPSETTSKL